MYMLDPTRAAHTSNTRVHTRYMYINDPLTATKANTRTHTDRALQHASAPERAVARSEVHLIARAHVVRAVEVALV